MFNKILLIRYIFLVAVFFTLLSSFVFLIGGVVESIHGYRLFFEHGLEGENRPGAYLLKGLDLFLVSMVFLIFAFGIMRIFTHYESPDENLPGWLKIKDFKELKILLWETVLVTLVVFTFTEFVTSRQFLKLETLIMPGVILILSVSLFLMKGKENH